MKIFINLFLLSLILASVFLSIKPMISYVQSNRMMASVFFANSIESKDIKDKYNERDRVKVMIVPGHDKINSGAVFDDIKESDMNLRVGEYLFSYLNSNKKVDVTLSRDKNGYNKDLSKYLSNNMEEIREFYNSKKVIMKDLISEGKIFSNINVQHNSAPGRVVDTLYGINKYVNDNKYDIVIHIHFNDYPGRVGKGGKYNGFSIYVPEKQYSNAEATLDLADSISNSLTNLFPKSNMPREDSIVEDQELIAIGSYNTADPASMLIEYGYIYERQFQDPEIKELIFNELAYQTYLGITDFFGDRTERRDFDFSNSHIFSSDLESGDSGRDVLALQALLKRNNVYPPYSNLNDCPISGYFGDCTEKSLILLQKDNGVSPTGYFGGLSRDILAK